MSSQRISIRVSGTLGQRLRKRSLMKGQSESEVVRKALETYLARTNDERSAYDLAEQAGLIGCLQGAPRDLSTSRRHLNGFGNSK
jgi:metal-responsive CopG/Arc/MetJ family transcriptional regulator